MDKIAKELIEVARELFAGELQPVEREDIVLIKKGIKKQTRMIKKVFGGSKVKVDLKIIENGSLSEDYYFYGIKGYVDGKHIDRWAPIFEVAKEKGERNRDYTTYKTKWFFGIGDRTKFGTFMGKREFHDFVNMLSGNYKSVIEKKYAKLLNDIPDAPSYRSKFIKEVKALEFAELSNGNFHKYVYDRDEAVDFAKMAERLAKKYNVKIRILSYNEDELEFRIENG